MPEGLMVGQELVDVADAEVEFQGRPLTMQIGRPRWHAVGDGELTALCGTAQRRLLSIGQPWMSAFPDNVDRCRACEERIGQ